MSQTELVPGNLYRIRDKSLPICHLYITPDRYFWEAIDNNENIIVMYIEKTEIVNYHNYNILKILYKNTIRYLVKEFIYFEEFI